MADGLTGRNIHIEGIVQGVGFRPFVYGLAARYELLGWVRNTSAGVDIHVDGAPDQLAAFTIALIAELPPLARIDDIVVETCPPDTFTTFEILKSKAQPGQFQPISVDVSICEDCLREMRDPADRRYRYPFINCTNCGPRFTIIKDIPYDRPQTTMAPFEMCADCSREYLNPTDRRFHAQPVACPVCGPQVWLAAASGEKLSSEDAAIAQALELLKDGQIIAIKGLGGFHLACDATNPEAVAELRRRKGRVDKPFALMMRDVEQVAQYCTVDDSEHDLLQSPQRPIVLLWQRNDITLPEQIAPGQHTLGVMLPYTPLHYLLFEDVDAPPLVMTSGNLSEEPIATANEEALDRLSSLADAFLLHDRDIHIRTDDSVVRVVAGAELPVRRSRGYAPYPVRLPFDLLPILATGAELKNTFCVTRNKYAFLSHHIGDMENYETLRSFEQGVTHFEGLFRIKPEIIACDLHPGYMTTTYAKQRSEKEGVPLIEVQHHHAHIAACMAEHRHPGDRPVIGVSFDGTGYGPDGAIWGGEFLIADYAGYERAAHLRYVPLPGGDAATRKPARITLAYLNMAGLDPVGLPSYEALSASEREVVRQQIDKGLNAPLTSSIGRLFDAVSSLAGVRHAVNYEGQAAIELEAAGDSAEQGAYSFGIGAVIDTEPMLAAVVEDVRAGVGIPVIAARFHNGLAVMIRDMCVLLREQHNLQEVALSGGVFQNITLLGKTLRLLRAADFTVYTHCHVPPNDGGLALGQAIIAAQHIQ